MTLAERLVDRLTIRVIRFPRRNHSICLHAVLCLLVSDNLWCCFCCLLDAEQLKALCLLFYRETVPAELQRLVELDIGAALASLPPWIIDILGIIAYARRHVDVLEHLVKEDLRASTTRAKTSFYLIGAAILSSRQAPSTTFQHSPNTPHNRELEWRLWTALLNAEPGAWPHYPLAETNDTAGLPAGLYRGLHWLADYWAKDHQLRASPAFANTCAR